MAQALCLLFQLPRRRRSDVCGRKPAQRQQLFRRAIAFRVHGRCVQRVFRARHTQKTRALLKRLGAELRHLQQLPPGFERARILAVFDDVLRRGRRHACHTGKQRRAGSVQVHTHSVHAGFHHAVQRGRKLRRGHVVLILPNTHGLGVDLYKLGQRVLQAPGNGYRAAQVHIVFRKLLSRQLGGRIHAGSGLAHHHIADGQVQLCDHIRRKYLGLLARGTVADGNDLHTVLFDQRLQRTLRFFHALKFRNRVNDGGVQHLARGVHHSRFAAHAIAGVKPEGHLPLDGRLQQKLPQVFAEYADGSLAGALRQARAHLPLQAGVYKAHISVLCGGAHLLCAGGIVLHRALGKQPHGPCGIHLQEALPLASVHGQNAVARHFCGGLAVIVIARIYAVCIFFRGLALHQCRCVVQAAQRSAQIGRI